MPSLALRTEVLRQRVLIDRDGQPLTVEDDEEVAAPAPQTEERRSVRAGDRAFFQRFIDEVVFDHAEQEKPVHGGENWVRAKLPKPVDRMVIWRSPAYDSIGVSAVFPASDDSRGFIESLRREAAELKKDSGLDLRLEDTAESVSARVEKPYHDAGDDKEQTRLISRRRRMRWSTCCARGSTNGPIGKIKSDRLTRPPDNRLLPTATIADAAAAEPGVQSYVEINPFPLDETCFASAVNHPFSTSVFVIKSRKNEVRNEEDCCVISPGCGGAACYCGHSRGRSRG